MPALSNNDCNRVIMAFEKKFVTKGEFGSNIECMEEGLGGPIGHGRSSPNWWGGGVDGGKI